MAAKGTSASASGKPERRGRRSSPTNVKTDDQNTVFEDNETKHWRAFGVGLYRDADGDGFPDWWEQQYFGSTTNCAPDADSDGDTMPNVFEYLADTNPTTAATLLRLTCIISKSDGVRLEWHRGARAKQFLERCGSISTAGENWVTIVTNNPSTTIQTNRFVLLGTNRTMFCRVREVGEWSRIKGQDQSDSSPPAHPSPLIPLPSDGREVSVEKKSESILVAFDFPVTNRTSFCRVRAMRE